MTRAGLFIVCMIVIQQACASAPPKPITTPVEDDAPRFYGIPSTSRDQDLICENVNYPGTCATVADVRWFLLSRRAE